MRDGLIAATPMDGEGPRSATFGRLLFRVRGWLFVPLALFALLWVRWEWEQDAILWPLGVSIMAAGAALRFASIRHIGGAARTHKDSAKGLQVSGPYAWVRNPLYLANLATFAGFVILCELPWFAVLSVLCLGSAYHAIARYEETVLRATHGREFEEYRTRIPMWIPRLPRAEVRREASTLYPMGKLVRRERGSIVSFFALIALAGLKELLAH